MEAHKVSLLANIGARRLALLPPAATAPAARFMATASNASREDARDADGRSRGWDPYRPNDKASYRAGLLLGLLAGVPVGYLISAMVVGDRDRQRRFYDDRGRGNYGDDNRGRNERNEGSGSR